MKLDNGTQILAASRAWFLIYQLQFYPQEISYISGLWENVRSSIRFMIGREFVFLFRER